ncbi:MAG: UbiA family prenyltransferase [Candidatus Moranbacteria bacterium]|nr:UbiA family prenyltransferase [Candidatus Moranbacteria bacterium]
MKNIIHSLKNGVRTIESVPTSYTLWLTSFSSLIIIRIMVENWLSGFESRSSQFLFYEFTHTFFFFLLSFLVLWPVVSFFGKVTLSQTSTILLFGFIIILTPPLLDTWIANGAHLWSFYKFDSLAGLWQRYFTLFGDRPDIGITYGVRIEVILTTVLIGIYTFIKTDHLPRSVVAMISTYSILFILGTFPSWLTFLILGLQKNIFSITDIDIASLFLSPFTLLMRSNFELSSILNVKMSLIYAPLTLTLTAIYLWRYFPEKFFALYHNARIPQIIYHGGLFLVGIGLALALTQATLSYNLFNLIGIIDTLIAIGCAWLSSVITNDLFDQKIDILTNPTRPLQKQVFSQEEYKAVGMTFFMTSLIFSALVSFKIMLLLLIYQALAWVYSAWPLRLKKFPVIATFFAALACVIVLIAGFTLIAPEGTTEKLPASFIWFFLFILTVFLPFKDFKDIAGDKADNVYTIPVLFGEHTGKLIIGSGIFLSYMLSISIFHEPRLFLWALLFGSLSFWTLMISQSDRKQLLSYHKLPGWLLGIAFIYGLILTNIIFY